MSAKKPVPAVSVSAQTSDSTKYPTATLAGQVQGRVKRKVGDFFGLANFGVNHTTLPSGSSSAILHHHQRQDEFVYIVSGTATLRLGSNEYEMKVGDCMGFPAGQEIGHCITNNSKEDVVYLEIGDRSPGEHVTYPEVDLVFSNGAFKHKDGTPY